MQNFDRLPQLHMGGVFLNDTLERGGLGVVVPRTIVDLETAGAFNGAPPKEEEDGPLSVINAVDIVGCFKHTLD